MNTLILSGFLPTSSCAENPRTNNLAPLFGPHDIQDNMVEAVQGQYKTGGAAPVMFSMIRPCHRTAAWSGKAALKTRALQTLTRDLLTRRGAKRLECVRFIGAFGPARAGRRFMVARHGLDILHEPPVWSPSFSRSGPPEGGMVVARRLARV